MTKYEVREYPNGQAIHTFDTKEEADAKMKSIEDSMSYKEKRSLHCPGYMVHEVTDLQTVNKNIKDEKSKETKCQ